MADLPRVVKSGEFALGDLTMHVHVLDTGQRVIEEADMIAFVEMLAGPDVDPVALTTFALWVQAFKADPPQATERRRVLPGSTCTHGSTIDTGRCCRRWI